MARDCSQKKSESSGRSFQIRTSAKADGNSWRECQVKLKKREWSSGETVQEDALHFLASDSERDTGG